jgi:hypothetical protein
MTTCIGCLPVSKVLNVLDPKTSDGKKTINHEKS